jgi:hypothetical protein
MARASSGVRANASRATYSAYLHPNKRAATPAAVGDYGTVLTVQRLDRLDEVIAARPRAQFTP